MVNLTTIKNWFKTGLRPTEEQFSDTWDSFVHKSDKLPIAQVEGIETVFEAINAAVLEVQTDGAIPTLQQVLEQGNTYTTRSFAIDGFFRLIINGGFELIRVGCEGIFLSSRDDLSQGNSLRLHKGGITFRSENRFTELLRNTNLPVNSQIAVQLPTSSGVLVLETAVTDTFVSADGKTITVTNGIITSITQ